MSTTTQQSDTHIEDWQPPDDIVKAAHEIDAWMQSMGCCNDWRLGPCASRKGYERLERENRALREALFNISEYARKDIEWNFDNRGQSDNWAEIDSRLASIKHEADSALAAASQ